MVGKLISSQVETKWCRLVGKELQVAQVAPSRPQYEKRGEREAARMNMLLRQGGFGASCAKSTGQSCRSWSVTSWWRNGAGWWGGKIKLCNLNNFLRSALDVETREENQKPPANLDLTVTMFAAP